MGAAGDQILGASPGAQGSLGGHALQRGVKGGPRISGLEDWRKDWGLIVVSGRRFHVHMSICSDDFQFKRFTVAWLCQVVYETLELQR